ncbi:MAG: formylmethanofuran dehydrogenase subunit B [Beggiatoa sp.]|nr:formylmethanofuran dehydrogenase subunit B [Beggiatoa sp.]
MSHVQSSPSGGGQGTMAAPGDGPGTIGQTGVAGGRPAPRLSSVPCPFCSMLCDDLVLEGTSGGGLRVVENGCTRAVAGFERPSLRVEPRIAGKPATREDAYARAAALLRNATQPLFAGLGTDVDGMRAVLALADRTGGIVDHMHGAAMAANIATVQGHGWMTTTLSEVKNRADLLLFIGTDAIRHHPRFFEWVVWNAQSLFGLQSEERTVIYLGPDLDTKPGVSPGGRDPEHIRSERERLCDAGATLKARTVAGIKTGVLATLVERLRAARYAVILWAAGDLDPESADLTIEAIVDLINDLNEGTRCAGLPLGGNDGGMSAQSVTIWQSGFPPPLCFASGYPVHDPRRYATKRLLDAKAVDCLFWISSFGPAPPPEAPAIPTVLLGLEAPRPPRSPEVFLPVATPGVDHAGQLVRLDSVVSLPLRRLRDAGLPGVAEALAAIGQGL